MTTPPGEPGGPAEGSRIALPPLETPDRLEVVAAWPVDAPYQAWRPQVLVPGTHTPARPSADEHQEPEQDAGDVTPEQVDAGAEAMATLEAAVAQQRQVYEAIPPEVLEAAMLYDLGRAERLRHEGAQYATRAGFRFRGGDEGSGRSSAYRQDGPPGGAHRAGRCRVRRRVAVRPAACRFAATGPVSHPHPVLSAGGGAAGVGGGPAGVRVWGRRGRGCGVGGARPGGVTQVSVVSSRVRPCPPDHS